MELYKYSYGQIYNHNQTVSATMAETSSKQFVYRVIKHDI